MPHLRRGIRAHFPGPQHTRLTWYDAADRVIVEIRERSWLTSAPSDVRDQRTCVVIRFRGDRICEMRDYTDAHIYEEFLRRHRSELPRFNQEERPGAARA